jgi:hypothetical protein
MVTSIKNILGKDIPMDEVRRQARIHAEQVLGVRLVSIGFDETLTLIDRVPVAESAGGL